MGVKPSLAFTLRTSQNSLSETVRKGVRATLRACICWVYGGQKGLEHLFSAVSKAALQVASRLFGQPQKRCSPNFAPKGFCELHLFGIQADPAATSVRTALANHTQLPCSTA